VNSRHLAERIGDRSGGGSRGDARAARHIGGVRLELRPGFPSYARLGKYEGKHRDLTGLGVNRQFEAIRQQRPHHQAHLVFCAITIGPRLDVEPVYHDPAQQLRYQRLTLIASQLVREKDIGDERLVRGREQASIGGIEVS